MKPYGMKRDQELLCPDVDTIKTFGLKSSVGHFRKKGGDYNGYNKPTQKAKARRSQARVARLEGKKACEDV